MEYTLHKYPRFHGFDPRAAAVDHAIRVFEEYQNRVGHTKDSHKFAEELFMISVSLVPLPKRWSLLVDAAMQLNKQNARESDARHAKVRHARKKARNRQPQPRDIVHQGQLPDEAVIIWIRFPSNSFLTEMEISDLTQCRLEDVCFWLPYFEQLGLVVCVGTALPEPTFRALRGDMDKKNGSAQRFLALIEDKRDWYRNRFILANSPNQTPDL